MHTGSRSAFRSLGWSCQVFPRSFVTATVRAMHRVGRAQVAHPFSLLPKIGLSEDDVSDEHLDALAAGELVAMLKATANNALGFAFKLAIDTISPEWAVSSYAS